MNRNTVHSIRPVMSLGCLLIGCTPQDLWPEVQEHCAVSSDECDQVLTSHFGVDVEKESARRSILDGLFYMTWWYLGEECFEWAQVGDEGAACFYNEMADYLRKITHDEDELFPDMKGHRLRTSGNIDLTDSINIVFDMMMFVPITEECMVSIVSERGLSEYCAVEEDEDLDLCLYFTLMLASSEHTCDYK